MVASILPRGLSHRIMGETMASNKTNNSSVRLGSSDLERWKNRRKAKSDGQRLAELKFDKKDWNAWSKTEGVLPVDH